MIDFDAEYGDHPPIPIKAFGEEFDLPGEMPALATMFMERLRWAMDQDPDADLDPDELDRQIDAVFDSLVGLERLERWRAAGASRKKLASFMGKVRAIYAEADRQGEAQAPDEGAPEGPPSSTSSTSGT